MQANLSFKMLVSKPTQKDIAGTFIQVVYISRVSLHMYFNHAHNKMFLCTQYILWHCILKIKSIFLFFYNINTHDFDNQIQTVHNIDFTLNLICRHMSTSPSVQNLNLIILFFIVGSIADNEYNTLPTVSLFS